MRKQIYSIAFGILVVDQLIKKIITANLVISESLYVIPKFFYLTYVKNTGGAWSILNSVPYLLVMISALFLVLISQYIRKKNSFTKFEIIYLSMIIGGVLGNFMDRILVDGVIDYLGFQFGNYYYPIFNLADIMIVLGIFLVIIETIRRDSHESRSRTK